VTLALSRMPVTSRLPLNSVFRRKPLFLEGLPSFANWLQVLELFDAPPHGESAYIEEPEMVFAPGR
jgi:hypothetical protein